MKSFLILLFVAVVGIHGQTNDFYYGAVVEYVPNYDSKMTPSTIIRENLNEFVKYISEAKQQQADIIVFPECGLTSIHLPKTPDDILEFTSLIPDPVDKINPCEVKSPWSAALQQLSCAAKTNNIYVVVNLPERFNSEETKTTDKQNNKIYNTNIVFDRTGAIIARYRKYNLFVEPGFNAAEKPDLVSFTTDFNVTFGTFICFDILFPTPALELLRKNDKITDIVYPTAWFSELPFLTAVQTQAGWARANGANLLVSGYSNYKNHNGGSGVYMANGDISYIVPVSNKTTLFVQKIPKIHKRKTEMTITNAQIVNKSPAPVVPGDHLGTWAENMTLYKTELINETVVDFKLCHEKICCVFNIKFNKQENADYRYRMVAYDGERDFAVIKHDVQICGVAACKNDSLASCGVRTNNQNNPLTFQEISVQGDFLNNDNSAIFPTFVDYSLGTTSNYKYEVKLGAKSNLKSINITVENVDKLLGFGIYGLVKSSAGIQLALMPLVAFLTVINYFMLV